MVWIASAKCQYIHPAFGDEVIREEYASNTIEDLVDLIQERLHWHGEGIWVVIPNKRNPACEKSVYASLLETPHPDREARYRVKVLPDRLVVRVMLP